MKESLFEQIDRLSGSAEFSDCRKYRYCLARYFHDRPCNSKKAVMFVMLNPSTADADADDPTIRRCIGFARQWGFDRLLVANLFAWQATDPKEIMRAADPIGPENDKFIERMTREAELTVCAWGKDGSFMGRAAAVLEMLSFPMALKLNQDGSPAHPLYQPAESILIPMPRVASLT